MAGCEGDGANGRTYITRRKKKKTLKKTEEGNGLKPERVRARYLDLRLTH